MAAVACGAVLAVAEEGLRFQHGEIDGKEMWCAIGRRIAEAGLAGTVVSLLFSAVAMAFPALLPVLGFLIVPLLVLGFAVFGARLAAAGRGWFDVWQTSRPLSQRWSGLVPSLAY